MTKQEMELKLSLIKLSPLAAAISLAMLLPGTAQSAQLVVNTTAEDEYDNKTSINEAIEIINVMRSSDHTLTFDASLSGKTLFVSDTIYTEYGSLKIDGSAAPGLTLVFDKSSDVDYAGIYSYYSDLTISNINITLNNNEEGVLTLIDQEYSSVTLENATFDGNSSDTSLLDADESDVTINNVVVKNMHGYYSAAISIGNNKAKDRNVSISNSVITNNQSDEGSRAGIRILNNIDFEAEGILYSNMTVHISNTSITDNIGSYGEGAALFIAAETEDRFNFPKSVRGLGGASINALIENVTISNNSFFDYDENTRGAGISIYSDQSPLNVVVVNSTIVGNEADSGSAVYARSDGKYADLYVGLLNTTIVDNSSHENTESSNAAVMFSSVTEDNSNITVDITNSVISNNERSYYDGDAMEIVTVDSDVGHDWSTYAKKITINANNSLIGVEQLDEDEKTTITGSNNIFGTNPMLGELADNGGPTLTMMPKEGSPLIDGGRSSLGELSFQDYIGEALWSGAELATDQRGAPRNVGGAPDIGAVEICAGMECEYQTKSGGLFGSLSLSFLPAIFGFAWLKRRIK